MKLPVKEITRESTSNTFGISKSFQWCLFDTPYGEYEERFMNRDYKVGDVVDIEVYSVMGRLRNRLKKLGIECEFVGNVPWVYLTHVNGVQVTEKFRAEHGFCAFMMSAKVGGFTKFSDRRAVFNKIREML